VLKNKLKLERLTGIVFTRTGQKTVMYLGRVDATPAQFNTY
jgi:hypothetical protein